MAFSYSLIRVWLGGRLSFKLHQFSIGIADANGELYTRASRTAHILHQPAHRSRESPAQVTKLPLLWHRKGIPYPVLMHLKVLVQSRHRNGQPGNLTKWFQQRWEARAVYTGTAPGEGQARCKVTPLPPPH